MKKIIAKICDWIIYNYCYEEWVKMNEKEAMKLYEKDLINYRREI